MMDRIDLFHLPFYKKEAFTGSDRGIRFWIGKVTEGEGEGLSACNRLAGAICMEAYAGRTEDQ